MFENSSDKNKTQSEKKTETLLTNSRIDLFEQIDFAQNISNQIK